MNNDLVITFFHLNSIFLTNFWFAKDRWGDLSLFQLNSEGLISSFKQLKIMMYDLQPYVVCLCETYLDVSNDSVFDLPGCLTERLSRVQIGKGGHALHVSDEFAYSIRKDCFLNVEEVFE